MSDPLPEQQPVLVYPNGVNVQPQSQTLQTSHSKGSFGASFIVLAVIIVVSAAACFLSRLCNKRGQKKHKEVKHDKNHKQKKGQGGGGGPTFPPQQSRRKEMDMEFGFGARVGPGPVPGRGFDHHHHQQQQGKGSDFEIGFEKKSRQAPKGSDIEMGFDRRFPNGKGAPPPQPPNAETMRGQQPYHHHPTGVMNGEANQHFNGGRWPGGQ